MESRITLGIEKMELDWGKNNIQSDHSSLFQSRDLKEVPYYYLDDDLKISVVMKSGFSKKISSVKKRLDLLGYTTNKIKDDFNEYLNCFNKTYGTKIPITFEHYYEVIKGIDVKRIDMTSERYAYVDFDLGEYVRKCVLVEIKDLKVLEAGQEFTALSVLLENISPYITLRILAENEENNELELIWRVADAMESGRIFGEDVKFSLLQSEKILIVTEGSTDTDIIKKSIDLLYRDVSDFFEFVDMEKNYPFTGTGNLKNFIKGLSKINIQNNVLVILDNDTVGVKTFKCLENIEMPDNLHIITLPFHDDFKNIKCYGPQGISCEDINGKAVAIEAFLDFESVLGEVYVRWTNYDKQSDKYQGVIEPKNKLVKSFHSPSKKDYNYDKITYLIDFILDSWINRKIMQYK